MIDLTELWKIYLGKDFQKCLQVCLEELSSNAAIDLLHIAGLTFVNLKRHEEGIKFLKAAITFRPESPHIYINAAHILETFDWHDEVTFFVDTGLQDFPNEPDLLLLKANNLAIQMKFDEAKEWYIKVLSVSANCVQAMINLGNIARSKDDFKEAERLFKLAEKNNGPKMQIAFARATMYTQMGQNEKSKALLEPIADHMDSKFLLALIYIADGDYKRGFALYKERRSSTWYKYGHFVYPLRPFDHWLEAKDKNIVIIQEGGLGDMLQYFRYIPILAEITKSITLCTPPSLTRLLSYNTPENVILKSFVTSYDTSEEASNYVTTDEEMPYHFGTTLETVPNKNPYITIPQEEIDKHLLPAFDGKKIGLCWAGGKRDGLNQRSYDARRSISFELLKPLLDIPNIQFYSLQLEEADVGLPGIKPDFDFADTAAVIAQLDLVISVDTSVVHLAAAMGKETWLLSRYDCCWRWNHNQSSPWYPNVTIFGQKSYKDWSVPLKELEIKLKEFAES